MPNLLPALVAVLLLAAPLSADRSQADKLLSGNRFPEAEAAYRALLPDATGAEAAEINNRLGMTLLRQYKCAEAVEVFQRVIDSDAAPSDVLAGTWLNMGTCYHYLKQFEKAIECYAAMEKVDGATPDNRAGARTRAGYAYGKLEKTDDAVAAFVSILEVEGANPFWYQMGLVHAGTTRQKQRRYAEAADYYRQALTYGDNGHAGEQARNRLEECIAATEADPGFYIAPYVSLVSPTEATIFWISNDDVSAGSVTLGSGQTQTAVVKQMLDRNRYRQSATFTDLSPYTLYEYTVTCAGRTMTGAFHTARAEPGPVRFVVLGDTQGGPHYHEKLAPLIAAEQPDFVLHVGDCVELGERWDEWKIQMFDPGLPYLSKAPIWVARGNHDGGPYFNIIFGREDADWQSFTFGDLHVIVLNSTYYMGKRGSEGQYAWLTEQFEQSTAKWQVVGLHHGLFHTANGDTLVGQSNFRPLIEKHAPDMVFNGHYHKYSRQLPIGIPGQKPLINVVTGGGGGGNGTPSMPSPIVAAVYESFHYTLVEIDGDTCNLTAKDIEGNTFDQYTLIKTGDRFQDEVMQKAVAPDLVRDVRLIYHDLKFPHYNRLDLTGQWTGQTVILDRNILDLSTVPAGARLIVEAAPDTKWTVPRQSLDLPAGELTFKATAPEDEKLPLLVTLNVEHEGRAFEPWTTDVSLRKLTD